MGITEQKLEAQASEKCDFLRIVTGHWANVFRALDCLYFLVNMRLRNIQTSNDFAGILNIAMFLMGFLFGHWVS